jgi:hypothetical protein
MEKMNKLINRLIFSLFAFAPRLVLAADAMTEAQIKINSTIESIKNSPLIGMTIYFGGAIVAFIALVLVVFLLIMLLKR